MREFITARMDYIFFVYGLAFLLLAAVCAGARGTSRPKLPWTLLGLFAVSHGANEWLDMVALSLGDSPWLRATRALLLPVSFLFLVDFGRSGVAAAAGRTVPRWMLSPLVLLAGLGALAGWAGLAVASRYCLGFTGAMLSSIAFLCAWKGQPRRRGWPLVASAAFALYAIAAGAVVPRASFPPANWLNQEAFLAASAMPIQLVRGLLAVCLAVSVYGFTRSLRAGMSDAPVNPSPRNAALWAAAVLAVALVLGGVMTDRAGRRAKNEIHEETRFEAAQLALRIADTEKSAAAAARAMSGSPWICPALSSRTTADVEQANSVLDRYNSATGSMVSYLMDAEGTVIASTNRGQPDSFVGQSYSFRPYFKDAISGGAGGYYAVGVTSKEPGYYASCAVRDDQGRIVGAIVIKTDVSRFLLQAPQYGRVFFVDWHGVIFLRSADAPSFPATLWPLDDAVREELTASRQFDEISKAPLLGAEPADGAEVVLGGAGFLLSRVPVGDKGWSVVAMRPAERVARDRLIGIAVVAAVCLLIVTFFITLQSVAESNTRVAESEQRYHTLVDNVNIGVYRSTGGPQGRFIQANPALAKMFNYETAEELMSVAICDLYEDPEKRRRFIDKVTRQGSVSNEELRLRKKDGTLLFASVSVRAHFGPDGNLAWLDGVIEDISDRKLHEQQLADMARRDQLTELPNRRAFDEVLIRAIARARRGTHSALLLFDLDRFKLVNETLGHAAGDDVLHAVAGLVQKELRPEDALSRLGGDEFAFILEGAAIGNALAAADRVRRAVADGHPVPDDVVRIGLSIGLAVIDGRDDARAVVAKADTAMYQAKDKGGDCVVVFQQT